VSDFHRHVPPNRFGRDFVVSDLHGHLGALRSELEGRRFIPGRDRLFSVGDLVDRGPDSPGCVALLQERWFFAVRGNHEDMLLRAVANEGSRITGIWRENGGEWGLEGWSANAAARAAAEFLAPLPWALTLHHRGGLRFGICHAECPVEDWAELQSLQPGSERALRMIWGRDRIRLRDAPPVSGIDLTIHGHTLVDTPLLRGNALFLETGAFLDGGRMTLLCLDDIVREGAGFSFPAA